MDVESFKEIFLPLHKKLYRIAYNLLGSEEDAKDIIQDAYYKLWIGRQKFKDVKNYEAFSVTMVKNLCLDFLRSPKFNKKNKNAIEDMRSVFTSSEFDEKIDSKDKLNRVKELIEKLPENQKQVLILRTINDHSLEEIEEITGFTSVNVRVLLSRARKAIKKDFEKKYNNGI